MGARLCWGDWGIGVAVWAAIWVAEGLLGFWGDGSVGKEVALLTQEPEFSLPETIKKTWMVCAFTLSRRGRDRSLEFTGLAA